MNESSKNISFKFFGWLLIAVLFAFLSNNYLSLYAGLQSSVSTIFIYILFVLGALYKTHITRSYTLRQSGEEIHQLNLYLIRAFFFAVLFVGVVDMFIALLRVEQILPIFSMMLM